jgi:4-amino-4-deoxy-L-arabinose transferase-like glycosyltransferase
LATVLGLAVLTLGVGLGSSGRLTYHEAIVAQAAREMLATGDLIAPTIGGRPWLEKPPLAVWLVAASGRMAGGIGETSARLPSVIAAMLMIVGVVWLADRRFGPGVGWLAGLVQATTAWTVMRGRLAEADIHLACLATWTVLAFDHLRHRGWDATAVDVPRSFALARWRFFAGLALMSMAKGVGFGAALVVAAAVPTLAWDGDRKTSRALLFWPGWVFVAVLSAAWPLAISARFPEALGLWARHVTDRLAERPEHFIGESSLAYSGELAVQLLPWLPLAVWGAWESLARALRVSGRGGGDRLLWAWMLGPMVLLSLATVRNAHYAIHAMPPCSIWAAMGLTRLGERLQGRRGWPAGRVRLMALGGFAGLGLSCALGFGLLGPWFDRRGVEWAFYEEAARHLHPGEPLILLYHVPDWDRKPYDTPFGPVPHDYAIRLFYLNRAAHPHYVPGPKSREDLTAQAAPPTAPSIPDFPDFMPGPKVGRFAVIGRAVDGPALERLGRVETLSRGPSLRSDRTYLLFRVTPHTPIAVAPTLPDRR